MFWLYLTIAVAAVLVSTAEAFRLIIDSNTMTIADLANASKGLLRSDGSYSIFVNTVPQASDKQWKAYIDGVSPADGSAALEFTEENPGTYESCKTYQRIQGRSPTASMGYHETGLVAGGTLLSHAEIDKQAKQCNAPVNVLTRSFCKTEPNKFSHGTDESWIVNTTRALANPNVYAIQMEFTPSWPLDGMQGCGVVDLMRLAISRNKTMMMLLPVCVYIRSLICRLAPSIARMQYQPLATVSHCYQVCAKQRKGSLAEHPRSR